jgi:hypothetical protein
LERIFQSGFYKPDHLEKAALSIPPECDRTRACGIQNSAQRGLQKIFADGSKTSIISGSCRRQLK